MNWVYSQSCKMRGPDYIMSQTLQLSIQESFSNLFLKKRNIFPQNVDPTLSLLRDPDWSLLPHLACRLPLQGAAKHLTSYVSNRNLCAKAGVQLGSNNQKTVNACLAHLHRSKSNTANSWWPVSCPGPPKLLVPNHTHYITGPRGLWLQRGVGVFWGHVCTSVGMPKRL